MKYKKSTTGSLAAEGHYFNASGSLLDLSENSINASKSSRIYETGAQIISKIAASKN